jgi:hypothetical protein
MALCRVVLVRRWWWVLLPVVGLLELVAHLHFAGRAPAADEWSVARELVRRLRRGGELVVVAPSWAEPLARHALGDELMPMRDLARPDESTYGAALELSILGNRASALASWRETGTHESGPFRVRALTNPRLARPSFNFVDELKPTRVRVLDQDQEQVSECRWNARARVSTGGLPGPPAFPQQRFQCAGAEHLFVGVTIIDDQQYRPRRCIWAHPPAGAERVIEFADVPLSSQIVGYSGLPWLIMRDGLGPPVELEIRVAGETIGRVSHQDTEGWAPFAFSTSRWAGRREAVSFSVRAESAQNRHFCFHADAR